MSELTEFSMSQKMRTMYRQEYESQEFREQMYWLIKRLKDDKYVNKGKLTDIVVQYVVNCEHLMQQFMKLGILAHSNWVGMMEEQDRIRKEIDDELHAMFIAQKLADEESN